MIGGGIDSVKGCVGFWYACHYPRAMNTMGQQVVEGHESNK